MLDFLADLEIQHTLRDTNSVAIGVSGGADSMALAHMLCHSGHFDEVHILTVDHGLRPEAREEAEHVERHVQNWPYARHHILCWGGDRPQSRVQENARAIRYDLLAQHCAEHAIGHLFLAHHCDDQEETLLFRLAKGSGLDGLSGMAPVQDCPSADGLILLRPLLGFTKAELLDYCAQKDISFIDDPSNEDQRYARVRLRQALAQEGLSAKRLGVSAKRLRRARQALDAIAQHVFDEAVFVHEADGFVVDYNVWRSQPEEISLRVLLHIYGEAFPQASYIPRMEKVEQICEDLRSAKSFRKRTLGGLIFARDDKRGKIFVQREI